MAGRKVAAIPQSAADQLQALYSFPTVQSVAAVLLSAAVQRNADYTEVALKLTDFVALEVRDNGTGSLPEVTNKREELRLLAALGTVTIVSKPHADAAATVLCVNTREIRTTGRLRKCGEVVEIARLFHGFPPREKEILTAKDHRFSLVLACLRCVLLSPDVRLVVTINSETVLDLQKHCGLKQRAEVALGAADYQSVFQAKKSFTLRGVVAAVKAMDERQSQFLYVDNTPVESAPLREIVSSHFRDAVAGRAKRCEKLHPAYILSLHFPDPPNLRRDGDWLYLDVTKEISEDFDECVHSFVRDTVGTEVQCDRQRSLKRQRPLVRKTHKQYTLHADFTDSELLKVIEEGDQTAIPKRTKLSTAAANSSLCSLIDDICTEGKEPNQSFALPRALHSFRKFTVAERPKQLRQREIRFSLATADFARVKYIGQFDAKCLLASVEKDGHCLIIGIDQHAAHERINLEHLQHNLCRYIRTVPVHETLILSKTDEVNLLAYRPQLSHWGFTYTMEKPAQVVVTQVPVVSDSLLPAESIFQFAAELKLQSTPATVHQ